MEELQMELENRIRNLVWTVCGDYTMEVKPDVESFLSCRPAGLYDSVKQGAFARFFDREVLSLYLVKKVYLGAEEGALVFLSQLCIEEAVGEKLASERPGVRSLRLEAYQGILERDFSRLSGHFPGRVKLALMREALDGRQTVEKRIRQGMEELYQLREAKETEEVIRKIDHLYNVWVDPDFEKRRGGLEAVEAVTLEDLAEFNWQDYLTEEMYAENLEAYLEQMAKEMVQTASLDREEKREGSGQKKRIVVVDQEAMQKVYSYIELNFGKTYLTPAEEKKRNIRLCRGIHGDCGLYYTDGILQNPVKRNYQYEYARKQMGKNKYAYYDNHRAVKKNIAELSRILKHALALRSQSQSELSDRGKLLPARLWKVGRTQDARLFAREQKAEETEFVVDVLIDASGSQRKRQEQVVLQAYILMEALSSAGIPHRVTSFCTFWDYTVLQRFREYDEDRSKNERIFEFTTSSNNRDGLAVWAAAEELLNREEEKKILILLSDGKPYDVVVNRPNARNPRPYEGTYAIRDTGTAVRWLRNMGVAVLGVFAGEERELEAEKKIFGKDFAYIRQISNFSAVVGRYLMKQLEDWD